MEWSRYPYVLTDERTRVDVDAVHAYLKTSYWAAGIPRDCVARSVEGSLCFSIHRGSTQVGFARVVSDSATFAYLADVYVLPEHRGQGLSKWMMEVISGHPALQSLRRWMLATRDAHGLYAKYGFKPVSAPERLMERHDPEIYGSAQAETATGAAVTGKVADGAGPHRSRSPKGANSSS